jgi:hypothetical protein
MPNKNGIEVVKEIRALIKHRNRHCKGLKILEPEFSIITAYATNKFH